MPRFAFREQLATSADASECRTAVLAEFQALGARVESSGESIRGNMGSQLVIRLFGAYLAPRSAYPVAVSVEVRDQGEQRILAIATAEAFGFGSLIGGESLYRSYCQEVLSGLTSALSVRLSPTDTADGRVRLRRRVSHAPELFGTLSDGKRYRFTTYAVQVLEAAGDVLDTIDVQDITTVERKGNTVCIETPSDRIYLTGATLDDAGRLEALLQSVLGPPPLTRQPPRRPPSTANVRPPHGFQLPTEWQGGIWLLSCLHAP